MKIIDLINKRANGDENLPKKFKFAGLIFEENRLGEYQDEYGDGIFASLYHDFSNINDDIEVIEEDKGIQKISINDNGTLGFPNGEWTARNMDKAFAIKINKLIDKVSNMENNK